MRSSRKRLLLLLGTLPALVLFAAGLYMLGMAHLEGSPRDFWSSLSFAAETLSTTGYGVYGRWRHPAMVLFVITLQFVGVFLVFLIFPIYLIPFLEERFEARLPRRIEGLEDHVVVYRHGPAVATLVEDLRAAGKKVLVVEEDDGVGRELRAEGIDVVHAVSAASALEGACMDRAESLIAGGSDEDNAAVILGARQAGFKGQILALVDDPLYRRAIGLAGADVAFTPRHVLAAALAARVGGGIGLAVEGIQSLGPHLKLDQIRVDPKSRLVGQSLREARIGAEMGCTVIGQWTGGHLVSEPSPEAQISPRDVLVIVGGAESLSRLTAVAGDGRAPERKGPYLICGFGEVGRKLAEILDDTGSAVRVIDLQSGPGVDIVGDVLDPEVLEAAGVETARAVILALNSESATLFATVVIRDLAPEVPLIARVNEAENVERIHQAGADFALSISQISSQMLAGRLLGRESVSVDAHLEVWEAGPQPWVGQQPEAWMVREKTGCSLVAVDRGGEILVQLGGEFRIAQEDRLYFCGGPEAHRRFLDEIASQT